MIQNVISDELAGEYFSHYKPVRSTKEANNPETARKLWEVSEEWFKGISGSNAQVSNENTTECA